MREARRKIVRTLSRLSLVALSLLLGALTGGASSLLGGATRQQQHDGPTIDPGHAPPLKYIPPEERAQLAQERDIKLRTRLSLDLAESHLVRAEQRVAASQYTAVSAELGVYQAVLEDLMRLLQENTEISNGKVSNRFRDLYKRIEMILRAHGPRLETIRRNTPSEESLNVRHVYEYTRAARAEALNSFYGESVLREGSGKKEKSAESDSTNKTPPNPQ